MKWEFKGKWVDLLKREQYEEAIDFLIEDYITAVALEDRYLSAIIFEELYKAFCKVRGRRIEGRVRRILELLRTKIYQKVREKECLDLLGIIEEDTKRNFEVIMSKYAKEEFEKELRKIHKKALDISWEEYKMLREDFLRKEEEKKVRKLTDYI